MLQSSSINIVSITRPRKQPPTDGARPKKILVKVGSKQQAMDILKAGRCLSELNKDRKVSGEPPFGIYRNLSGTGLLHRNSIWPRFKAAKTDGKQHRWQMG